MPPRKPRRRRKPPVSLSDEQLLALLQIAKQHRERDFVLILLTYWHGLRASEAVSLRESDFDLAAGTVQITRGKGSDGGSHTLQEHENPMLNERVALGAWLANRGQFGVKGGAKARQVKRTQPRQNTPVKMQQSSDAVTFSGLEPEKMRQNSNFVAFSKSPLIFDVGRKHFWRLVNGYARKAGIPQRKCHPHVLKHTLAKNLVRQGVPLNEIQAYIGWASIATLDWYLRADEEELGQRIGNAIRAKIGLRQVQQGSLFS